MMLAGLEQPPQISLLGANVVRWLATNLNAYGDLTGTENRGRTELYRAKTGVEPDFIVRGSDWRNCGSTPVFVRGSDWRNCGSTPVFSGVGVPESSLREQEFRTSGIWLSNYRVERSKFSCMGEACRRIDSFMEQANTHETNT